MAGDYTTVTEVPGVRATREQMSMLYTRYKTAAAFCGGKDVLEVACGSGLGLGYLVGRAGRVVGGDYTEGLLRVAHRHYAGRVPLVQLDAHLLPFRDQRFDVVILYEAIYYLAQPEKFLDECRRVLRDRGVLLVCTVNKEWSDFNPSPFSTRYFAAQELGELLKGQGFGVELYGAFPVSRESAKDRMVSVIKRVAVSLHLIPKTMKGKEALKRLFFGRLTLLPPEVTEGMASLYPLVPITGNSVIPDYKVLYAIGRIR
jgi:ubiquinone/menaquinone biosynthesis C-methylase UbiE